MSDELERAKRVKREHESRWLSLDGVVAVGVGQTADGRPAVVVSVRADSARLRRALPERVDGVPVEVRVSGDLRAL
jgi:hypothetical protein